MKNILLLGGNGFIGKNLKAYFSNYSTDYMLAAPARGELNLLNEGLLKKHLTEIHYDVIIDAAICNPIFTSSVQIGELQQDLRMFYNLEKYNGLYGKLLYFGSGAEYDKGRDISNVTEEFFPNEIPSTDYGLAKYIVGKTIEQSSNLYNLRVFGLFGKYENWRTTFISGACCKALKGLPISIRQNVVFDYLYIDDFCRIVHWFVENDPIYHSYNVVSGKQIDLVTLAEKVKKISRTAVPIYVCKSGLANEYTGSNQRLIKECKNILYTNIDDSIRNLLNYYQENIDDVGLYPLLYQK